MIKFKCSCGSKLEVSDKYAGKVGKCPACDATISVPSGRPPKPSESTEEAGISFRCPCGQAMAIRAEYAGKQCRCSSCDQVLVVPGAVPTAKVVSSMEQPIGPRGSSDSRISEPVQNPTHVAAAATQNTSPRFRRTCLIVAASLLVIALVGVACVLYFGNGRVSNSESESIRSTRNPSQDKEDEAHTYCVQGIAHSEEGLHDLAIQDLTKAIELKPGFAVAYYNRGVIYSEKGLHDLAIQDLTKAIELKPGFAGAYRNRGFNYSKKGLLDLAIKDYTKAIELEPDSAVVYYLRSVVYAMQKDHDASWADLRAAQKLGFKVPAGFVKALLEASRRSE